MKSQKEIFKASEADEWFNRNKSSYYSSISKKNMIADILNKIELYPKKVLEIGCSNGFWLNQIGVRFD